MNSPDLSQAFKNLKNLIPSENENAHALLDLIMENVASNLTPQTKGEPNAGTGREENRRTGEESSEA